MIHAIVAWLVRSAFALAGLALLAAGLAAMSTWLMARDLQFTERLAALEGFSLKVGVTFLLSGLPLLLLTRSWRRRGTPQDQGNGEEAKRESSGWMMLLAVSLVALPILALCGLGPLRELWIATFDLASHSEMVESIEQVRNDSDLLVLLALSALLVPLGATLTVVSYLFCSLCLLPLFALRSRLVPRALLMGVLLQFALLFGTFYAMDLDLVGHAHRALVQEASAEDADAVKPIVVWAERHQAAVKPIAGTLGWTFLGYALWLPAMILSSRARTIFVREPTFTAGLRFLTNFALKRISFDGANYAAESEMPQDARKRYQSLLAKIAQAAPDLEKQNSDALSRMGVRHILQRLVYNGRAYDSLDELPPKAREHFAQMPQDHKS